MERLIGSLGRLQSPGEEVMVEYGGGGGGVVNSTQKEENNLLF